MELGYTSEGFSQLDAELQCEALINGGMSFGEFVSLSIETGRVSLG